MIYQKEKKNVTRKSDLIFKFISTYPAQNHSLDVANPKQYLSDYPDNIFK